MSVTDSSGVIAPAAPTAAAQRGLRLGVFGCPLDTGNLGVSALGYSVLQGLRRAGLGADVTLFGYTPGEHGLEIELEEGPVRLRSVGCHDSRRLYRTDNLRQVRLAAALGAARWQPMARRLAGLDAILDISGGDSFSDIYGMKRFKAVAAPKLAALELGVPLVLLPQTYGPYNSDQASRLAKRAIMGARQVWARDERSLVVARELLGEQGAGVDMRAGVDVAFGLPAVAPSDASVRSLFDGLAHNGRTLVGLNVSGLLYNEPGEDVRRYGFRGSYREIMLGLARRLLAEGGVHLLLTPHVMARAGQDCDAVAVEALAAQLTDRERARVTVAPMPRTPSEAKWMIGRCAWFCGTRMHSCIAAISQGVPCAAIAYSDKALGVFESAGVGDCVVDPRALDPGQTIGAIAEAWRDRDRALAVLAASLPTVKRRLDDQFRAIGRAIAASPKRPQAAPAHPVRRVAGARTAHDESVDVLMITYNSPEYTRLSLARLLETADESTRVWLWHNGDDEETLAVVRSFLDHPRVHRFHHSEQNVRLRPATNWLFSNARGAYLSKVDDDCLVPLGWLDALRAAHRDEPRFGAIGCWRFQEEDFDPDLAMKKVHAFRGGHRLLLNWWIEGSGYLMKRQCVEGAGLIRDGESFTAYCRRLALMGWVNGWRYPFLHQDHMEDPRSPNTLLRTEEDFAKQLPLSAVNNNVKTVRDWDALIRDDARIIQKAPPDPISPYSPRGMVVRARRWCRRRFGDGRVW